MSDVTLRFWGVRGSIPTPEPDKMQFGGNTACVEIDSGDETLIIDAGSGIRNLGAELSLRNSGQRLNVHLLLTHFHWDHLQGMPFFSPLYVGGTDVTFYSSCHPDRLRTLLEGQMAPPYFPVSFKYLSAHRHFVELKQAGHVITSALVHPFPMNHPQGATGFRIETNGTVITHASDFEPGDAKFDKVLREFAQDADVLIFDAQYTPEEYPNRRGWGHSTWAEAARVAAECDVHRLILFHHDPGHDDAFMTEIEAEARKHFPETFAAKEGWEFDL